MWPKRSLRSCVSWALACFLICAKVEAKVDFWDIASKHGVDPLLLYSVALAESARPVGKARVAPWPWTINSSIDGPKYFDTRQEAEEYLKALLAKGAENIDIGLMQINLKFHRSKISDPIALLDPERNLRLGARLLRQMLESTEDAVLAVGKYHSGKPERAYSYGQRVWKIYYRLLPYLDRF